MAGDPDRAPVIDTEGLAARLRMLAVVVGGLTFVGVVADGLVQGLTFAVLGRWVGISLAALLVLSALVVAVDAFQGVSAAQRRGDRLSGDDVGLVPPRRRRR
jgi:hypothetical protein